MDITLKRIPSNQDTELWPHTLYQATSKVYVPLKFLLVGSPVLHSVMPCVLCVGTCHLCDTVEAGWASMRQLFKSILVPIFMVLP